MNIEDVVVVSTVRDHIHDRKIQVDAAEIPLSVETEQLISLRHMSSPSSSRESEAKADEGTKATKENLGAEANAEEAGTKAKAAQKKAEKEAKAKEAADREAETEAIADHGSKTAAERSCYQGYHCQSGSRRGGRGKEKEKAS
jgi:cytoskeletal protein RodZ